MMRPDRRDSGFTLVELVVYMAVASVVTMAAITVLLLGLRINKQSTDTVKNQNTTRILLSALEDIATEGSIKKVESGPDAWAILTEKDGTEVTAFSYNSAKQTIYTGTGDGKTALLTGVVASFVEFDEDTKLLHFGIETLDGTYTSSVYCRTAAMEEKVTDDTGNNWLGTLTDSDNTNDKEIINQGVAVTEQDARLAFLKVLAGQYGSNGDIKGAGDGQPRYFSEWYIGSYADNPGWNANTPWCACFVSWALCQDSVKLYVSAPADHSRWYSHVGDFRKYFDESHWKTTNPIPGDIIFFDWDGDGSLQHVGVVLYVTDDYVYTIEGNSANRVAVRKYKLDDPRVIGYGVIDWKNG